MKYKFKIGNTSITDDKIDKHKNFKKLKANYDKQVTPLYKRPLYKDPKALLVVLVIALLTYVLVETYQKESTEEQKIEKNDSLERSKQTPPAGEVSKPAMDTIKYPSKSIIKADSKPVPSAKDVNKSAINTIKYPTNSMIKIDSISQIDKQKK